MAHVDHGKTTMSDSLLASSGLLSPSLAGSALAL
ncbi:MAG: GTP-binding protein, partial [Candidatus Bathyarchaeota archaeon]|nr:GTP-binding protein [Candidatus Bathyarchaeota archaeon]